MNQFSHKPKMKLTIQLKDLIYWAVIGILLWLAFRNTTPEDSGELDRVKFQRDSIISAMIDASENEQLAYRRLADSCRNYVSYYEKADSINKYKLRHERRKIPHYTPAQRSRAVDSILSANNIR